MQDFVEKTAVAEAKKELLNFTVDVLKDEGVISDKSLHRWHNIDIRTASVFDGISDIYSWWQYGLQWEYVQIGFKRDVIKITKVR
ncbi:MAG: hypothetical protein HQK67_12785 [Desulfamplus sp.]|nr:hypothetical protein [Desulfamplus sp.]